MTRRRSRLKINCVKHFQIADQQKPYSAMSCSRSIWELNLEAIGLNFRGMQILPPETEDKLLIRIANPLWLTNTECFHPGLRALFLEYNSSLKFNCLGPTVRLHCKAFDPFIFSTFRRAPTFCSREPIFFELCIE